MKVYYSLEDVPAINNPVLTLGTYDGVHKGHQAIISYMKESAKALNGESVLFTFHPHPRIVLHPEDHNLELIQDLDQRIERLREAGIDHLILYPFTHEFSRLTATEFVRNILVNKLNIRKLIIGYNHHFGRNREGNLKLLKDLAPLYNFEVSEIPAFQFEGTSISSTKIREALKAGEIQKANNYLGSTYKFKGKVVQGKNLGHTIGFPTANIEPLESTQIIPKNGVYVVQIALNAKMYSGMMNIGIKPTISEAGEVSIEVHIFDFSEDIYGSILEVKVIDYVREERTFGSLDELKQQLKEDEAICKNILSSASL